MRAILRDLAGLDTQAMALTALTEYPRVITWNNRTFALQRVLEGKTEAVYREVEPHQIEDDNG